jgi:hypothetical protein
MSGAKPISRRYLEPGAAGAVCAPGSPFDRSASHRRPIFADVGRLRDPCWTIFPSARDVAALDHSRSESSSLVLAGKRYLRGGPRWIDRAS